MLQDVSQYDWREHYEPAQFLTIFLTSLDGNAANACSRATNRDLIQRDMPL